MDQAWAALVWCYLHTRNFTWLASLSQQPVCEMVHGAIHKVGNYLGKLTLLLSIAIQIWWEWMKLNQWPLTTDHLPPSPVHYLLSHHFILIQSHPHMHSLFSDIPRTFHTQRSSQRIEWVVREQHQQVHGFRSNGNKNKSDPFIAQFPRNEFNC